MNLKITKLVRLIALPAVLYMITFSSCSKGNELVGSWSEAFTSGTNDYAAYRAYTSDDYRPTLYHSINFEKASDGDLGTFTDNINAIVTPANDEIMFAGSKISGKWEAKDGKLYLYYDDEVEIIGDKNLSDNDISVLENEMTERFLADFKKAGANGLPYKIEERNGKKGLNIDFGGTKVILTKNNKSE